LASLQAPHHLLMLCSLWQATSASIYCMPEQSKVSIREPIHIAYFSWSLRGWMVMVLLLLPLLLLLLLLL
jgi:hypothetical protein